jgi:hypothetical protein
VSTNGDETPSQGSKERERFEQALLPHLDAAYNPARWLTGDDHDAEDRVQGVYLRALKFFGGFHGTNSRAWLLRIVRNVCYSRPDLQGAVAMGMNCQVRERPMLRRNCFGVVGPTRASRLAVRRLRRRPQLRRNSGRQFSSALSDQKVEATWRG